MKNRGRKEHCNLRSTGRCWLNLAGTAIPKPFEEATLEEMDRVLDINTVGVYVATQGGAEAHEERWPLRHHESVRPVGERVAAPGLVPYAGTKGANQDVHSGAKPKRSGSRGITVNNVQLVRSDTELNPASGDWAVCRRRPPQRLIVTGVWRRSPRWWRLSPDRSPRTLPARILPSTAE